MIRFAHITCPMPGETRNGDAIYTRTYEDTGIVLACVIDALGHGPNAAQVADRALAWLAQEPAPRSAVDVVRRMHEQLKGSRGAAATVCVFDGTTVSACGVGNVALRSHGSNVPFVLSPGVLGARVHSLRPASITLKRGDRVVLHSDGVSSSFSLDTLSQLDTESACKALFDSHRKKSDDATVLVADVVG